MQASREISQGNNYLKAGEPVKAVESFKRALKIYPSTWAWEGLGDAQLALGRRAEAREAYEKAVRDPSSGDLQRMLIARKLVRMADLQGAALVLGSLSCRDVYSYELGQLFLDLGAEARAVDCYRVFQSRGDLQGAAALLAAIAKQYPSLPIVRVSKYVDAGLKLHQAMAWEKAAACFDRALELAPDHHIAREERRILESWSGGVCPLDEASPGRP